MKKRITSIFLIVSIIISVFTVSAVTTSAAQSDGMKSVNITNTINGINVHWNGSANYILYYQQKGTGWKQLGYTLKNSGDYSFIGFLNGHTYLVPGKTYFFQFKNVSTGKFTSVKTHTYSLNGRLSAPTLGCVRNTTITKNGKKVNVININWNKISNDALAGYCMWYKIGNTGKWYPAFTTSNYWNIEHPVAGTKFTVKISSVAFNGAHSIPYSNEKTIVA